MEFSCYNSVHSRMDLILIPVYRGAESAVTIEFIDDPPYDGEDGFGDANLEPIDPIVETEHAVLTIIRLAKQYKGNLTFVALGPLTNLAMAVNLCPEIRDYFKEIIILGGNIEANGNVAPAGEFNFMMDAEAARTVLERFTSHMTIVPLETWENFGTSTYAYRAGLGLLQTPQIDMMNRVEAKHFENNKESWNAPDALVAAVILEPSVATKAELQYCTVELRGEFTRGMMLVDRKRFLAKPANAWLVTDVDRELYERILLYAAGGPDYQP